MDIFQYLIFKRKSGSWIGFVIRVEFSHATKADLKNARGAATWKFAKVVYLANLKSNVNQLDMDKLKNVF